jgi:hypothetical protein
MSNKVWYQTVVSTEDQNIEIFPNETFNGIIVKTKEVDLSISHTLYLNKKEMEFLIAKMQEMMKYVLEDSNQTNNEMSC